MEDLALLKPFQLGSIELRNRMVMAPMTRDRAGSGNVPTPLTARYYAQRASAGLIVTEATQISPQGIGYPDTPGIYTDEQVAGWKRVTREVHELGGVIYLQLWHVGRISHPSYHGGELPVAPSAVRPAGKSFTPLGLVDYVTPRPLETDEIPRIVEQYGRGAARARRAGFDGVEVHAANGYLIDQFLLDGTNKRGDRYGGSIPNRARFLLEVLDSVCGAWGGEHVGIRLSPAGTFNDMYDSNPVALYEYLITQLQGYHLDYVHIIEPLNPLDPVLHGHYMKEVTPFFRDRYGGTLITNANYTRESAERAIVESRADLVSFGRLFLANPDLPRRFALDAPLNEPDPKTFYGGDERGYVDYPPLEE